MTEVLQAILLVLVMAMLWILKYQCDDIERRLSDTEKTVCILIKMRQEMEKQYDKQRNVNENNYQ